MEVKELGHLVLYVRNLDRSVAFYRDVLGWRMISPDLAGRCRSGPPPSRHRRTAPTMSCS